MTIVSSLIHEFWASTCQKAVAIDISINQLPGIVKINYSNTKLNEWIVNLKRLCKLWAFLSVLFIRCRELGLKVSLNQSNNIMWCTMTPNTVEWLWRALERNYLIIKIRIDGVKGKVRYMNEESVCMTRFSDVGMWAHDDTRSPFLMPWWKFMASVMRSTRPQVWVKPPLEFSHIFAGCKAGGTITVTGFHHHLW